MKLLIALAVLFTYGLQYFVALEIMWGSIKDKFSHKFQGLGETLFRAFMVLLTGKKFPFVPGYCVSQNQLIIL